MYSFEGHFRRKPEQNLGGVSSQKKTDRESLILQSKQQRQKREEERKRQQSAVKIQSCVRMFIVRCRFKSMCRTQFDNYCNNNQISPPIIRILMSRLVFFYNYQSDINRLIGLSQKMLTIWQDLIGAKDCIMLIRRILGIHVRAMKFQLASHAIPMRILEVFTSLEYMEQHMAAEEALKCVCEHMVHIVGKGYFKHLKELLNSKTPHLYEQTTTPPTPLSGAALDLLLKPLEHIGKTTVSNYDDIVLKSFSLQVLSAPHINAVEHFLLPVLQSGMKFPFPYLCLLNCLCTEENYENPKLMNSMWLLYSVLTLAPKGFVNELKQTNEKLSHNVIVLNSLTLVAKLSNCLIRSRSEFDFEEYPCFTMGSEDEESDSESESSKAKFVDADVLKTCMDEVNDQSSWVMTLCSQLGDVELPDEILEAISLLLHNLMLSHKHALQKYRLLYTLAFKPVLLRGLWRWLSSMNRASSYGGSSTPLLSALSRGMGADGTMIGVDKVMPPLTVFCGLFSLLIGTLHDTEFCKDDLEEETTILSMDSSEKAERIHAFKFSEMGALCRTLRYVCFGLVELAYPDLRTPIYDPFGTNTIEIKAKRTPAWAHLFKVCSHLLRSLYVRSSRLHFCRENEWPIEGIVTEGALAVSLVVRHDQEARAKANAVPYEDGPPLTRKEFRTVMILREIPFIVPFATRVFIFQGLLMRDRQDHFYELANFNEGPSINISVRRSHLYEDAFDKLSPQNEPDMKLKLRVQLVNQAGADEAGVDGGGLFREFLSELLKSAFDPNRGLFRLTRDNMLYPNPGVGILYENYLMHYFFVGRMLGKALFENLLVELPLADFFLEKMCSLRDLDVHALASLDPALYHGLLKLRSLNKEEIPDLGLDFTMISDEFGEQKIEELKPGGANIPVTAENRIQYIHLVADYKLNRQIRRQCMAFKRGLTMVVSSEWLRMFSCKELQLLISGAEVPIDVEDLKNNTHYAGVFTATHPTVQFFWKALEEFADDQRRMLLKFVTSCSRPPLLGFKDLQPPFCIQSAGPGDRLPSASTCMNLLKLPEFDTQAVLHERLLYAIMSGAGFELS